MSNQNIMNQEVKKGREPKGDIDTTKIRFEDGVILVSIEIYKEIMLCEELQNCLLHGTGNSCIRKSLYVKDTKGYKPINGNYILGFHLANCLNKTGEDDVDIIIESLPIN